MQYLLTQSEYDQLTHVGNVGIRDEALLVAKNIILEQSGFPCIHKEGSTNEYCDHCPCSFTATNMLHKHSELLCTSNKEYSQ